MKIILYSTVLILSFLLQFSCTQEENARHTHVPGEEDHTHTSQVGTPIVQYYKDSVSIYNLIRNSNSELKREIITKSNQEEITVPVYYKDHFQFDVPIRKKHPIPDWKYEAVDTIVAISDIEGNYKAFVSWLKGNNIITEDFKWSYGNNHLVINGDVMDRGSKVFQVLWLIYKLEPEAEAQGGKVHFVLGNHEELNIQGHYDEKNLSYVNKRYFEEAELLGIDYSDWLSNQTELGKWIRTKNAMEQINNEMFVHAGISMELKASKMSIQEINDVNRSAMNIYSKEFNEKQTLVALKNGPLWYRGMAENNMTEEEVSKTLGTFNSKRMVIGHTMINEENIIPLFNGLVIPIDLNLKKTFKKGMVKGIMISEEGIYELDNKRNKVSLEM